MVNVGKKVTGKNVTAKKVIDLGRKKVTGKKVTEKYRQSFLLPVRNGHD